MSEFVVKWDKNGGNDYMYELFKGGVDILFYVVAGIVIIGAIVKKTKAKKKDDK